MGRHVIKNKIELDLITDLDMLNMIEKMKRGGLCFVGSKRHVKANNKYLDDYDSNKPSNYLMYWDANNLYGWAMVQSLPYKNLKFIDNITIDQILETPDDSDIGFICEVDLEFPQELHDKFKDFPPCPEAMTPNIEWFSDFQKEVGTTNNVIRNGKYNGSDKLIPHLMKHERYVIHYRNLKFIKSLGVKITNLNKVISFDQKEWLKPYIDFNTDKRKEAKNEFEKDFFKLMNNSVFGKTMENVKNRIELKLTTDNERAIKWFSKLEFKNSKFFDGLHMIEMFKKEIVYDKPIYVGTTILDLSKLCMMDFHYNVINKEFENKHNLIYSDTDSLVYSIENEDIYEWVKNNKSHFDLSDSIRPDMKDNTNEKVIGKMKDEFNGLLISEFIGLNPKAYSINHQTLNEAKELEIKNKKTLKGVSKVVVKNEISHNDYINVLNNNEPIKRDVISIRSFDHQLFTHKAIGKVALTSFYDKFKMIDNNNNLPYGYRQ